MKRWTVLLVLLIPIYLNSQSLGSERIERLNKAVVQIYIDTVAAGTGFFINEKGHVATNYHVIKPALKIDKKTSNYLGRKRIYIHLQNGEKIEANIPLFFLGKGHKNAVLYDYISLVPIKKPNSRFETLKIGTWKDINEGDEIYACGFPFGIQQRVISKGMLSTKYQYESGYSLEQIQISSVKVNAAWLDMTMNRGNSGGPVLLMGKNYKKDKVIGMASFILNPYGEQSEYLAKYFTNPETKHTFPFFVNQDFSSTELFALITTSLAGNSLGVSACISIDYLQEGLEELAKPQESSSLGQ